MCEGALPDRSDEEIREATRGALGGRLKAEARCAMLAVQVGEREKELDALREALEDSKMKLRAAELARRSSVARPLARQMESRRGESTVHGLHHSKRHGSWRGGQPVRSGNARHSSGEALYVVVSKEQSTDVREWPLH